MPSDAERSDRAQAERVEGLLASVQDAVATLQKLGSDLEREVARALYRDPATNTSALATLELENARLKQAVEGRAVIEQAKGVIIARQGGSEQEAFSTLTRIARREKVSLRDAAAAIVEAGARSSGLQHSGTPATGVPRPGKTADDDPKAKTVKGTDPQGLAMPDLAAPNIVVPQPVSPAAIPPAATRAAVLGDEAEEFRIPALLAAMPEVSRVLGNADKHAPAAFRFARPAEAEVRVSDIFAVRQHAPHLAHAFADHARAFVEVQTGCDHRCTFCVIPYGRGDSRSVPAGAVIDRIAALVDAGHREVVLTGVDLTSYGADLPGAPNLGGLVARILRHAPSLPRLRLSSLDSIEIDDRLFALVTQEPRVMPHLHLSLQSGDDMILKRMKRRHSRADAVAMVARLKAARPEIAIGADLIAGFPTETSDMAANTLALLEDCDVVFGHVFPFSPRPGTPAARMRQVPGDVIRERAKALREVAARRRSGWLASLVGTVQQVLVERDGLSGHAGNFAKVRLLARVPPGMSHTVRMSHVEDDVLICCPA